MHNGLTEPGQDTARLSAPPLGQLLLMQSVLGHLPDEPSIFGFVCRGLCDVPGVAAARHAESADEPTQPGEVRLPLHVGHSHRGELVLALADPVAFAPYEPYLQNFAFMIAVILEERHQRRVIRQHQEELEQRVQDRTRELTGEMAARQVAVEELRRNRNMLAHILDSVPQGVFWKDREGLYLGCNRVFARAVGIADPEDIAGKTDFDLPWPRAEAERYRADDHDTIARGQPRCHIVEPLQQSDGKRLWIDTTKVPLTDAAGWVYGVLGVYDDITERMQAEAEREKLQAQLLQAQKMESVGRLAGGVAHDFNNMLQAILGHVNLALAAGLPGSQIHENLEEIERAARRSAELTRQLLTFARKQTVRPRAVDLNEIIAHLLKMLRRLIGENIQLAWHPGPDLWPVRIDPVQVDQILVNLAVNARDAIDGAGRITIETENRVLNDTGGHLPPTALPGDYVAVTITDTGCGMDTRAQAHLFEPFFTTKGIGKGTGLGLATVYGVVQQNRGHITVQSEPGKGTTFTIHLPRSTGSAATTETAPEKAPARGTETILLVEDEEQVLALTRRILRHHGYNTLTARSPHEALELLEQPDEPIALLVTDLIMPGMNGRELYQQVATFMPGLRCLYISGYTADAVAQDGVLDPGVQFLQKPFTVTALLHKVREVLDGPGPG